MNEDRGGKTRNLWAFNTIKETFSAGSFNTKIESATAKLICINPQQSI
jgi:hypothetical protein